MGLPIIKAKAKNDKIVNYARNSPYRFITEDMRAFQCSIQDAIISKIVKYNAEKE